MDESGEPEAGGPHPDQQRAEILAPGPVLALAAFAIGAVLHLLRPHSVLPVPWNYVAGGLLVLGGLGVLLTGLKEMRQIDKSPAHSDEPRELITSGPFRYTRNPLYLGLIVIYVGLTAVLNSLWPLLPLVVLVWYFNRMARREEAYLEAEFGEEFTEYAENVRRWL